MWHIAYRSPIHHPSSSSSSFWISLPPGIFPALLSFEIISVSVLWSSARSKVYVTVSECIFHIHLLTHPHSVFLCVCFWGISDVLVCASYYTLPPRTIMNVRHHKVRCCLFYHLSLAYCYQVLTILSQDIQIPYAVNYSQMFVTETFDLVVMSPFFFQKRFIVCWEQKVCS